MIVVWDEAKRSANLDKHGIDFAEFDDGFDLGRAVEVPTYPSATGRPRRMLIGPMEGWGVVVAIVSRLGTQGLSLVSLRRATGKEKRDHGF